jgi:hypothetical protein
MGKKGYNKINNLKRYKIILDIVNTHYNPKYTTYAGVFRTFVEPIYPMNYNTFMKIVNMPGVEQQLEAELARVSEHDKTDTDRQNI